MKLNTILEFPLSHIGGYYTYNAERERDKELSGSVAKPSKYYSGVLGRYSFRDKAIITHPKTVRVLEQKLSNSEYNFNILFYEMRVTDRQAYESQIRRSADRYIEMNDLDKDNSITFVKNGSSGDSLTPWMILHCIGHAAFDFTYKKQGSLGTIYDSINSILYKFLKYNELDSDTDDLFSLASKAFVFSSVQQEKIEDNSELLYELMAEYLWNGTIRVNSAFVNGENRHEILSHLAQLIASYDVILKRCVGSIILDIT